MLLKCCTQYAHKFGKLSNGHRTGKGQFSLQPKEGQCQRMFKLLHNCIISHAIKVILKFLQARLQQYVNQEVPDCTSWVSKRQRNQRSNCQHSLDHAESKGVPGKTSTSASPTTLKAFDCVNHNKLENS